MHVAITSLANVATKVPQSSRGTTTTAYAVICRVPSLVVVPPSLDQTLSDGWFARSRFEHRAVDGRNGGGGCIFALRLSGDPGFKMWLPSNSTDNLLNSFPMFGHPGISALEYAGQVDAMKEEKRLSDISLKRKSEASTQDQTTTPDVAASKNEGGEVSPPLHFIDEFGYQRRRGTFINHTPRSFEVRASPTLEVYRPSTRAESENYSRPLSRQSSMANGSPANSGQHGHSSSTNSGTLGNRSALNHNDVAELDSTEIGLSSSPDVYVPSTKSHRRSLSAPYAPSSRVLMYRAGTASSKPIYPSREPSLRSASLSSHPSPESKRQRRQTPFKINTTKQTAASRHAPLEPLVARIQQQQEEVETIGGVPIDPEREMSAEMGTFGVIQRYFDSQGGGPVPKPQTTSHTWSTSASTIVAPTLHGSSLHKSFMDPIVDQSIDELKLPEDPPQVPARSPKRITNPVYHLGVESEPLRVSDFNIAAEGEYSPYDTDSDVPPVTKKKIPERHPVGQLPEIGSPAVGRLAPPILGHDAITASADLRLNDLAFWLRNTGPKLDPQPMTKEQKKMGMRLFKVKQRNSLAARFGSVEGSPQRARTRPAVPSCAREMTTAGGAKHLKIVIPTESPSESQATTVSLSSKRAPRRSRHISISFTEQMLTEEMLNPLASPEVERMLSNFDTRERSASAPNPRLPRSPKRSPMASVPVPVKDHPLATRDEMTRARKLRDLQRIKRKPVATDTSSGQNTGGLPTPAHTPEPSTASTFEDEGVAGDSPVSKMERLQDRVITLQRQNTQLAEALAKIVGLELNDGDLKSEDVLDAFRRIKGSNKVLSIRSSKTN
jgi:hypothetical protein